MDRRARGRCDACVRLLPALLIVVVAAACDAPSWRWEPDRGHCALSRDEDRWLCEPSSPYWFEGAPADSGCHATLCLAGWGYEYSDGNDYLEVACPTLPGLVEFCPAGGACRAVFYDVEAAGRALVEVAAQASAADESCPVSIVAHSWGSFDAADLVTRLREEGGGGRIDRLVTLDPYRAFPPASLDVPPEVGAARNFFRPAKHEDDCSEDWGGFDGLPIRCDDGQDCAQVNLLEVADEDPGHCSMIWAVWGRVLPFVSDGVDPLAGLGEVAVERR